MHNMIGTLFKLLFDMPGDGGAGGGGGAGSGAGASPGAAGSVGSAPAGGGTPSATPGAPSATPAGAGAAAAAARKFEYDSEYGGRSNWLPPERLSEVTSAWRTANARAKQLEAMIKAGTGVDVPGLTEPVDPHVREARGAFAEVMPGLASLEDRAQDIAALPDKITQIEQTLADIAAQLEFGWRRDGRQSLSDIQGRLVKELGVDKLNPFQQRTISGAFQAWLEDDSTNARLDRYAYRDPGLFDEFMNDWKSGFADPYRRLAQAGGGGGPNAARLPAAPAQGSVVPSQNGQAGKPLTEDEVHDRAYRGFMAARAAGGQ